MHTCPQASTLNPAYILGGWGGSPPAVVYVVGLFCLYHIRSLALALAAYERGNVVIYRGIYQLQGDDNGHVGRHCEVSKMRLHLHLNLAKRIVSFSILEGIFFGFAERDFFHNFMGGDGTSKSRILGFPKFSTKKTTCALVPSKSALENF